MRPKVSGGDARVGIGREEKFPLVLKLVGRGRVEI